MLINKDVEPEILEMLEEYRRILENAITDRTVYLSGPDQDRLTGIKRRLARMGLVLSVTIPNPALPEEFAITAKGPHPDMTPEERAAYDEWFCAVNDLPRL